MWESGPGEPVANEVGRRITVIRDLGERKISIRELIEKFQKAIRIPVLQRKYVWSNAQVRNLLDSLYRGYPTGTLLMWEPEQEVRLRDEVAPQGPQGTRPPELLLLDGQQRVTSLWALATGEKVKAKAKGKSRRIEILFNLNHPEDEYEEIVMPEEAYDPDDDLPHGDEEDGESDANSDDSLARKTFEVAKKEIANKAGWISVTKIFKEMVFGKKSSRSLLQEIGITSDSPNFDRCLERMNRLENIVGIKYHTQVIQSPASYAEATEIFARVNSGGSKLRKSDLALALMTVKWEGAVDEIDDFEDECTQRHKVRFGSDLYVRNLISFATERHKCGFDNVRKMSEEDITGAWEPSKKGMAFAMEWLANKVGSEFPFILSSPFPLITIANYAHQKDDRFTDEERTLLRFWSIAADMKGRYTRGATETNLDNDLQAVRKGAGAGALVELLERQVGSLRVRQDELETTRRGPHFGAMFLAFRNDGAEDWKSSLAINSTEKRKRYSFEVHHIFPKKILNESGLEVVQINTLCNLAFVLSGTNKSIGGKKPDIYLPELIREKGDRDDFLRNQCIPTDPKLWRVENYKEFLKERRWRVAARLNEFLADPRPPKPEEG